MYHLRLFAYKTSFIPSCTPFTSPAMVPMVSGPPGFAAGIRVNLMDGLALGGEEAQSVERHKTRPTAHARSERNLGRCSNAVWIIPQTSTKRSQFTPMYRKISHMRLNNYCRSTAEGGGFRPG